MQHRSTWNACARVGMATLALLVCLCLCGAHAETDGMLRVMLARLGSPSEIRMCADCDYTVAAEAPMTIPAGTTMTLVADDGSLTLTADGLDLALSPGDMLLLRRDGAGSIGMQFLSPALSNRFCGDLCFSATGDAINTLLRIYVEDYLYGAVGCAMAPSSPLEALKAQAVVARNYALRQKAARASAAYDLADTGDALSYRGYNVAAEYADVLRAVDDTKGQTLYYEGSPATCYFCDSNGGQIESAANALDAALPYSTVRDDPYDYDGSGAKKTAVLRKDAEELAPDLTDALKAGMSAQLEQLDMRPDPADVRIDAIVDIAPGEALYPEPSRLYASLSFQLTVTGVTADGDARTGQVYVDIPTYVGLEDWYDLSVNDADNETIWISETDRTFEITFRRSGSGLGMSQRGAQVMAKKGFSCADILEYYYPGTELRRLELADAARSTPTDAALALASVEPVATARLSQKTRLYESPDETVAALTTLPAGATVEVYAVQGDWAALSSRGSYGYAHTDALTDFTLLGVTAAQVKDEALAKVGAGSDVLQLPVDGARVLARLAAGDTVRLTGYTDAWARISTADGVDGFVARSALTLQGKDGDADDGEIVTAPDNLVALLIDDAGLYVNADDSIAPRRTLTAGDTVQILAYNRSWAYARTEDGMTGFVKLGALSQVATPTPENALPEEVAPEPAEAEISNVVVVQGEVYRYVNADALPMFEASDAASAVLTTLNAGDRVRLGAYNDEWACVRTDGLTGFVLLSGLSEEPPATPGEIEGGEITVVKGEQYATVARDGAALYAAWDASQPPLENLALGERVQLGAYNRRWACVRANGVTGFMLIEDLELTAAPAQTIANVNYLECEAEAAARLELYADADLTGAPLAELNKGARLHVYAFNRSVAYVEYDGVRGFVSLSGLTRID